MPHGGHTASPAITVTATTTPVAIIVTATTTPVPRTHGEEEGERHQWLLPIHRVVSMLQEVRGLLVNQAVGVTRDARGAGCPPRGHGHAPRYKHAPVTSNRLIISSLATAKCNSCRDL